MSPAYLIPTFHVCVCCFFIPELPQPSFQDRPMQDRIPGAARVFWSLLFCSRAVTKQKLNRRAGLLTREATHPCLPSRVCVGFSPLARTQTKTRPKFWQRSFSGLCGPHRTRMGSSQMGQASVASGLQTRDQLSLVSLYSSRQRPKR